jgi:hypothetical protein
LSADGSRETEIDKAYAGLVLKAMSAVLKQGMGPRSRNSGVIECPKCGGSLSWSVTGKTARARSLGVRAACQTPDCLSFLT